MFLSSFFAFLPQSILGKSLSAPLGLIAGLLGIGFLIGFHELGHFLFAKLFNVRVPSFSIGFGPRLITKRIGETEFSLSAVPLGGYVELAGAAEVGQGEQKHAHATDERSFKVKPFYQKFLILMGGILFNILFAYLALMFIFKIGVPETQYLYPLNASLQIQEIKADTPAALAQLQPGDVVTSLNGKPVASALDFVRQVSVKAGETIEIGFERNGTAQQVAVALPAGEKIAKSGIFSGIIFKIVPLPAQSFSQAISSGFNLANKILFATVYSFKYIFIKRDLSDVRGPIYLISETASGAAKGFQNFLIFLAIISINLAILNLIPLPILDGGQIFFYGLEALFGRAIPARVKEYIFMATWLAFITLFIYLSYKDILAILRKIFGAK